MATTEKLDEQTNTAKGLKDAIVALNDVNRAALDSMAGFEEAIDAASKAVEDNGRNLRYRNGELDLSTEKARAEEKALSDLASKTEAAAVAALNNGDSMDKVNAIYDKGRERLMAVAQQMGLNREQARQLTDQILSTPDKTAHLRGDAEDLKLKLAEVDTALRNTKGEKRWQFIAEKDALEKQLADIQKEINAIHGKTVTVMVQYTSNGSRGALGAQFAHGGIIGGAATGGPRGGLTWVGEQGPELVRLPGGSTVIPAGQSRTMAGPSGGGRGVGALQVEWVGGNAGDEFMSWLRKNIRIRGGDVQAVLGRG